MFGIQLRTKEMAHTDFSVSDNYVRCFFFYFLTKGENILYVYYFLHIK